MANSQNLRFLAQQAHQLRHGGPPFADDLSFLPVRWRRHGDDFHPTRAERGRLHVEGFLLRRHDSLESGIPRLVQTFVRREHRRERKLHHLQAALDLSLSNTLPALDLEVGHRGDARQIEQLGNHGTDLMVVVVDGHLAEQDQVVAAAFELRRQGGGGRQSIGRDPVRWSNVPRSAPMARAVRMVSCAAAGPSAITTTSPEPACSLRCKASSTANSSYGLRMNLTPASSSDLPSAAILTRVSESGTRLMQTAIFMGKERKPARPVLATLRSPYSGLAVCGAAIRA